MYITRVLYHHFETYLNNVTSFHCDMEALLCSTHCKVGEYSEQNHGNDGNYNCHSDLSTHLNEARSDSADLIILFGLVVVSFTLVL